MTGPYDDILHLPYPLPTCRPRMAPADRAAQFSPFAALSGYDASIRETGRLTDSRTELTETRKEELDRRLQYLAAHIALQPPLTLVYFQPDTRKAGGAYVRFSGHLKAIFPERGQLVFCGGKTISIEDITELESPLWNPL